MITDHQISWLKEFLLGLAQTKEDRESAKQIVDTFRELWKMVNAAKKKGSI